MKKQTFACKIAVLALLGGSQRVKKQEGRKQHLQLDLQGALTTFYLFYRNFANCTVARQVKVAFLRDPFRSTGRKTGTKMDASLS